MKLKSRIPYIELTDDIMDFAVNKLKEYESWNVYKFPGTGRSNLFKYLPEAQLPAAIVNYDSSSFRKSGGGAARTMQLEIIIAVEFFTDDDKCLLREMLHKVIELLDSEVFNAKVSFDVISDTALDLGSGVAAYVIKFNALNY